MPKVSTRSNSPSQVWQYSFALSAIAMAVLLRWALDPIMGNTLPLVTLFGAVAAVVWVAGFGPTTAAIVLGYVACAYLFIEPRGALGLDSTKNLVGFAAYLLTCSIIVLFGQLVKRSHLRAELGRERLRVTIASVGDAVITTDPEGRVTMLNRVAEDLTGWTQAEALGVPLQEVFKIINEQSREPVENPVQKVLERGQVVGLANHTVLVAKDGAERPIDDSAAPIRGPEGQIEGVVLVFHDVSERRKAERELRESEARKTAIFQTALDCIITMDHAGNVVEFNRAAEETFGFRRDAVLGKELAELIIPHRLRAQHRRALAHYLATGEGPILNRRLELTALRASGEEISVELAVTAVPKEGQPLFTAYLRDITERKRLENENAARMKATSLLASIVSSSEDAIISKSLAGVIQSWNSAAERLFGYAATEAVGQSITLLIPPARLAEEEQIIAKIQRGERVEHFETVRIRKDGRQIPVSLTISPIRDETGTIVGASKIARDITEQQRLARAVRESRELLHATLLGIGDAVIATDIKGQVVFLNRIAEELTGWSQEEAQGQNLANVFHVVNETTRLAVENPALRALQEGVIVGLANHSILISKSGQESPIDDSAAPIRDANGAVTGAVLVFRDITERKKAEAALRRSEERLRQAQEVAKIGTFEWNIQTGENTWTPELEAMYGLPSGGFRGSQQNWEELVHPDDRANAIAQIQEALNSGTFQAEWRVIWPDGTVHWLAGRASVFRDGQGRPQRLLGVNIDITKRKLMEEELRRVAAELSEANRRKDEFLATLAHELRNPLAPIRNGLHIMRLSGDNPESLRQTRTMMERQLEQMVRLVDDLLDLSRISRGRIELRLEYLSLAAVIQSAVETTASMIEAAGHTLAIDVPAEPIPVHADLTRLAQVFANLLNNAAKYTERGGQIWLSAKKEADEAVVAVRDTGIGIPADMIPRVFDMFTQIDRSLDRSQGGLGVGLTLSKRLVELHGGTIDVQSDGEKMGSTFTVRLPIAEAESVQAPEPTAPELASPRPARRILVADDNQDAAMSMAMMLRILGHEVRTTYDGLHAVKVAGEFRPEVILLDIGMPGLNGYEACRRIKGEPWTSNVVCVALTGWGQDDDKRKSAEAGFDHHLVKPVDFDTVSRLIAAIGTAH